MKSATIIRHPKERRSKCSLTPLEGRGDLEFFRARSGWRFEASGYTVLGLNAPVLSEADAERPLLLLDSTWRLLPQLESCLVGEGVRRSLPSVPTAYPRVSKVTEDPLGGLASVEALFSGSFTYWAEGRLITGGLLLAEGFSRRTSQSGMVVGNYGV